MVSMCASNCDTNFGEITEVVPWDILAHDCGQDLQADQPGTGYIAPLDAQAFAYAGLSHVGAFRLFKSHETFGTIPKGGRYIYVARDPLDAFYSFYHFLPSYVGLCSDDIDQRYFCDAIFAGASHSGQIWNHMLGWWEQRHSPQVLFVFFEEMLADLGGTVRRVADFLQSPLTDAQLESVVELSSFTYMSDEVREAEATGFPHELESVCLQPCLHYM